MKRDVNRRMETVESKMIRSRLPDDTTQAIRVALMKRYVDHRLSTVGNWAPELPGPESVRSALAKLKAQRADIAEAMFNAPHPIPDLGPRLEDLRGAFHELQWLERRLSIDRPMALAGSPTPPTATPNPNILEGVLPFSAFATRFLGPNDTNSDSVKMAMARHHWSTDGLDFKVEIRDKVPIWEPGPGPWPDQVLLLAGFRFEFPRPQVDSKLTFYADVGYDGVQPTITNAEYSAADFTPSAQMQLDDTADHDLWFTRLYRTSDISMERYQVAVSFSSASSYSGAPLSSETFPYWLKVPAGSQATLWIVFQISATALDGKAAIQTQSWNVPQLPPEAWGGGIWFQKGSSPHPSYQDPNSLSANDYWGPGVYYKIVPLAYPNM